MSYSFCRVVSLWLFSLSLFFCSLLLLRAFLFLTVLSPLRVFRSVSTCPTCFFFYVFHLVSSLIRIHLQSVSFFFCCCCCTDCIDCNNCVGCCCCWWRCWRFLHTLVWSVRFLECCCIWIGNHVFVVSFAGVNLSRLPSDGCDDVGVAAVNSDSESTFRSPLKLLLTRGLSIFIHTMKLL